MDEYKEGLLDIRVCKGLYSVKLAGIKGSRAFRGKYIDI